jgi:hypothetical protein
MDRQSLVVVLLLALALAGWWPRAEAQEPPAAPARALCRDLDLMAPSVRVSEWMNQQIAADRTRFVSFGNRTICAW